MSLSSSSSSFLAIRVESCLEKCLLFVHFGLLFRCRGSFFGTDLAPHFLLLDVSQPFGMSVFHLVLAAFRFDESRYLVILGLFLLPVVVAFLSVLQCLGIGFVEDFLLVNALVQRVDFIAKLYQHSLVLFSASIDVVIEDLHLLSEIFSEFICLLVMFGDDLEEPLTALS